MNCISLSISIRELKLNYNVISKNAGISLSISIRELKQLDRRRQRQPGISLSISIRELKPGLAVILK